MDGKGQSLEEIESSLRNSKKVAGNMNQFNYPPPNNGMLQSNNNNNNMSAFNDFVSDVCSTFFFVFSIQ